LITGHPVPSGLLPGTFTSAGIFMAGTNLAAIKYEGIFVMEGWEIIQSCELAPETGVYGKRKILAAISNLSTNDLNRFCRTYLHLMEFYSFHRNCYFTDDFDLIKANKDRISKAKVIDFDAPVTFIRRV
jgi:hypothetical protein